MRSRSRGSAGELDATAIGIRADRICAACRCVTASIVTEAFVARPWKLVKRVPTIDELADEFLLQQRRSIKHAAIRAEKQVAIDRIPIESAERELDLALQRERDRSVASIAAERRREVKRQNIERARELDEVKLGSKKSKTYCRMFELPINSLIGSRFLLCCLSSNKTRAIVPVTRRGTAHHKSHTQADQYGHYSEFALNLSQYQETRCRIPGENGVLSHRQACDFNPAYSRGDGNGQQSRRMSEMIDLLPSRFPYWNYETE